MTNVSKESIVHRTSKTVNMGTKYSKHDQKSKAGISCQVEMTSLQKLKTKKYFM